VAEPVTLRPVPFKLLHLRAIESLRSKFVPDSGGIGKVGPVQIQDHDLAIEQLLPFRIPVVFKISSKRNRAVTEAGGRSGDTKILLHSRQFYRAALHGQAQLSLYSFAAVTRNRSSRSTAQSLSPQQCTVKIRLKGVAVTRKTVISYFSRKRHQTIPT